MSIQRKRLMRPVAPLCLAMASGPLYALDFNLDLLGQPVEGVSNTTLTFGAQWRMEDRAHDLVGKSNLNPDVCGRGADGRPLWQSCQGVFRTQTHPAEHLAAAPGQFTTNGDDGNWNYDRYDITQAPFRLSQDISLRWNDWAFFARGLFFYDVVNDRLREYHPNRITADNLDEVGVVSTPGDELIALPLPLPVLSVRNDSRPCPAARNPSGGPCGIVYGKGGVVRNHRDGETRDQIGRAFQLQELMLVGNIDIPSIDRELSLKIGRQVVVWGETTLLWTDSLAQANPINANNFFRVGQNLLEDNYTPVGMIFASISPFDNATLEGYYQLEWRPTEAPAYGSFYSFADVGSHNGGPDTVNVAFGGLAEDPDRVASLVDNPLSGVSNTSSAIRRLKDREPGAMGQFGIAFKYYAETLNNGTEFGLYFSNYHSRLPIVSFVSAPEGCAKNVRSTADFILACPDVPLLHALTQPNDPEGATSDATQFDNASAFLEYPKNVQMIGASFNTTVFDFSVQGEVAFRPNNPLQVDLEDLGFAAYGPVLPNCHLPDFGCEGSGRGGVVTLPGGLVLPPSLNGIGTMPDGTTGTFGASDYVIDANGTPGAFTDTFDLLIGHAPGQGRAFPSFVVPYRGMKLGTNPPNSYIRGYEEFKTFEFNLGATYIMEASHWLNLFKADQIIWIFESGANWIPDLPPLDKLQLEAPGTYTHASAGADGSGADRSRQACSTNVACSYGPDGLRFNPHQQDLDLFPDKLSAGYVVAALIKYESVLPGISLGPQIVWKHDVYHTAPGLAGNFVEGRKIADAQVEVRFKDKLSFTAGYQFIFGGGPANLLRDRDSFRAFVKYAF